MVALQYLAGLWTCGRRPCRIASCIVCAMQDLVPSWLRVRWMPGYTLGPKDTQFATTHVTRRVMA
jgi:hypothetical protein